MKVRSDVIVLYRRIKRCIYNLEIYRKHISKYHSYTHFESIDWHDSVISEIQEALNLISKYNSLNIQSLSKVKSALRNKNAFLTLEEVAVSLNEVLREIEDVNIYLDIYLRPNLTEKEKGKIDLLRKDLDNLETEDKIRKNLEIALMEAESGHKLACGIISARVVVERLEKIKGENDEDRLNKLIKLNIIENTESSKHSSKAFLDASRSARNAISHKDSWFPSGAESLSLLASAFRMAEWVSKYLIKMEEIKDGKKS